MQQAKAWIVLGIDENATPAEIRNAYKDLVKVWNPERFLHDPHLYAKAEQHIREIDEAFDVLNTPSDKSNTDIVDVPVIAAIPEEVKLPNSERKHPSVRNQSLTEATSDESSSTLRDEQTTQGEEDRDLDETVSPATPVPIPR